jgi:hypothetical protein
MSCTVTRHIFPYKAVVARGDYAVSKIKCVKGTTELTVESFEMSKSVYTMYGFEVGITITIKLRVAGAIGANETVTCYLTTDGGSIVDSFDFQCSQSTDVGVVLEYSFTELPPPQFIECLKDVIINGMTVTATYAVVDYDTKKVIKYIATDVSPPGEPDGTLITDGSIVTSARRISGQIILKTKANQCVYDIPFYVSIPSGYPVDTYIALAEVGETVTREIK